MRIRIWPILLLGLSTLVALIAFSGFSALQRARASYAGTTQLYTEELQAEQALGQIRSDVLLSAIAIRDLLLLPGDSGAGKRAEVRRLRDSSRSSLRKLNTLIADHATLTTLKREVEEYWTLLDPIAADSADIPSSVGKSFLRNRIFPHRQAVLTLATQIEELTRDSVRKRREIIDRRQADLPFYVSEIVSGTILVGILVAGASLIRIAQLEETAGRQHRAVVDAEEQLRRLSQQMVTAQEEERRSLSRELHDQIGQVLTAVRIGIGNLEEALQKPGQNVEVRTQLDQSKRLSEQALRSVRDIAMGLRPAMLDDLGLGAALEWQARQFSRLCDFPVSVDVTGNPETLSDVQRTCIYRVVQEALNNAAKHARASEIDVMVAIDDACVQVEVRDNGIGFDVASHRKGGLGLVGMQERVRQLRGQMIVESNPGHGTVLRFWAPQISGGI